MLFVSPRRFFLFGTSLKFCSEISGHVGKRLDKKAKVNFKTCKVTNWK